MDLANISSFLSEGTPTWTGLWTGVNPMDFVTTPSRSFIISKDGRGVNAIYEVREDQTFDTAYNTKRQVRSVVYTKEYDFKDAFIQKREHTLTFQFKNLGGNFKLRVERKPAHSSAFILWDEWEYKAPVETCEIPPDEFLNGVTYHQIKELIFGDAQEAGCSPITDDEYDTFTKSQLRIILEGEFWELDHLQFAARIVEYLERPNKLSCDNLPVQLIPLPCDDEVDWRVPPLSRCDK
jgi:hypothetical protein